MLGELNSNWVNIVHGFERIPHNLAASIMMKDPDATELKYDSNGGGGTRISYYSSYYYKCST